MFMPFPVVRFLAANRVGSNDVACMSSNSKETSFRLGTEFIYFVITLAATHCVSHSYHCLDYPLFPLNSVT
jgi:hypothetical protein